MIEPQKWASTLGSLSDTVTLPDEDLQFASFKKLFPALTQVPLSEGGVAPQRTDFNTLFKLLGDNIFYLQQGGVFSYSDTADYEKGAFVKYNNELYLCIQDNSALNIHNPEDMDYWLRVVLNNELSDYLPTGVILPFGGSTIPNGWLLANGSAVSRSGKARLFSVYGTTFGAGDGSTTFNLPDLRDRYIIGVNTNALGSYIAEQLPNILGLITAYSQNATAGMFAIEGLGALQGDPNDVTNDFREGLNDISQRSKSLKFNASISNSIYTDNGHVYPRSLALNFIIKS